MPPLYSSKDAEKVLDLFSMEMYHKRTEILPGIFLTFYNAGHILGSAMVFLEWTEDGSSRSLLFSGDLGRKNLPILIDSDDPPAADIVLMESTYGDRYHDDLKDMEEKVREIIQRTYDRGGKIIIPSFELERAQEVIYTLKRLEIRGELPNIPIFVDSPLTVNVTQVFRQHTECFDEDIREVMLADDAPFRPKRIKYIRDNMESIELNSFKGPCIIILASGMCEHGRIQHHLKNNCTKPENTIMIVEFQAQHTLGRRIVEKQKMIRIFGIEYPLKAEVEIVNAFSCHAGQTDLIDFATAVSSSAENILLVHGEERIMNALQETLATRGIEQVKIPVFGERLML
jgi:metallo-beta-lactamase family protein